jgi:hypothetical protein
LKPPEYVTNSTLGNGFAVEAPSVNNTPTTTIDLIALPPGLLTQRTQRTNGEDAEE